MFIVDNPQQLSVKFPVKGRHKICMIIVITSFKQGGAAETFNGMFYI